VAERHLGRSRAQVTVRTSAAGGDQRNWPGRGGLQIKVAHAGLWRPTYHHDFAHTSMASGNAAAQKARWAKAKSGEVKWLRLPHYRVSLNGSTSS
jgi:hypothetical protein